MLKCLNPKYEFKKKTCMLDFKVDFSYCFYFREILKNKWKILNGMPKFSVQTHIDIIMAVFTLYNYVRRNSEEDMLFNFVEHPH